VPVSCLEVHRAAFLVAVAGAVGCSGGENQEVSCPAVTLTCPATPPDDGAACPDGASGTCEYGDDILWGCDTIADCYQGTWSVSSTPIGMTCPTAVAPGCPSSFADALAGPACPATGLTCLYPEGKCQCGPGAAVLGCAVPPAGCPETRPRLGTPCSGDCPTWGSGGCDGETVSCTCGVWHAVYCAD
jgi:hypothetical protein